MKQKHILTIVATLAMGITAITASADTHLWVTTEGAGFEMSTHDGHLPPPPPPPACYGHHHGKHCKECKKYEKERKKAEKRYHKEMKKDRKKHHRPHH